MHILSFIILIVWISIFYVRLGKKEKSISGIVELESYNNAKAGLILSKPDIWKRLDGIDFGYRLLDSNKTRGTRGKYLA